MNPPLSVPGRQRVHLSPIKSHEKLRQVTIPSTVPSNSCQMMLSLRLNVINLDKWGFQNFIILLLKKSSHSLKKQKNWIMKILKKESWNNENVNIVNTEQRNLLFVLWDYYVVYFSEKCVFWGFFEIHRSIDLISIIGHICFRPVWGVAHHLAQSGSVVLRSGLRNWFRNVSGVCGESNMNCW